MAAVDASMSRIPHPALAPWIDELWYHVGPRANRERSLPTASLALTFGPQDTAFRVFDDRSNAGGSVFRGVVIGGPRPRFFLKEAPDRRTVLGVHFRPGGAAAFLGLPLSELAGHHVQLEDVCGREAAVLRDRLEEALDGKARLDLLEQWLLARLHPGRICHPAVAMALSRLRNSPGEAAVGAVVAESGLSARRLITLFHAQVGLTPKRFCRIHRLRQVVDRLVGGEEALAQIALAVGYSDQSHMIRDFRELTGITPAVYRRLDRHSLHQLVQG